MRRRGSARAVIAAVSGLLVCAGGCATPVVLENPATKERVNCTTEAIRAAAQPPGLFGMTGHDVPRREEIAPAARQADYERQCVGTLKEEGYLCISGCR